RMVTDLTHVSRFGKDCGDDGMRMMGDDFTPKDCDKFFQNRNGNSLQITYSNCKLMYYCKNYFNSMEQQMKELIMFWESELASIPNSDPGAENAKATAKRNIEYYKERYSHYQNLNSIMDYIMRSPGGGGGRTGGGGLGMKAECDALFRDLVLT
ncbi:MAG TPA: hypothetical protein PK581_07885, partial [Caldisericia bacterium]|nr:hypothetical protein [Caldisericia bacterium]